MPLEGIFAPLTVPFAKDGAVDHAAARTNVNRYNRTPLSGYVINGSTGESVLLKWAEVYEIWETVRASAAPGKTLIAGTGAESTSETIEATNRAAAAGYDFALVRTPSYYRGQMSVEAEAEHYLRVADAAKIPILLYSVPANTNYTIEPPLVERVAAHPNIAGMKDSSGNVPRVRDIVAVAPKRVRMLVGAASALEPSLREGASGGVLALACALPEMCCELYEAHHQGDAERARRLQEALSVPSSVILSKHGIPGLKYALDTLGYIGGLPRPPLLPASETAREEINAALAGVADAARSVA